VTTYLFILNDPPYGTERSYNGLRLARTVSMREDTTVRVFLVGDASFCAKAGQQVPKGYYNIERMVKSVARKGAEIGVCGTCMDARGMTEAELVEGTRRSSLEEWTTWTAEADKVLVF